MFCDVLHSILQKMTQAGETRPVAKHTVSHFACRTDVRMWLQLWKAVEYMGMARGQNLGDNGVD